MECSPMQLESDGNLETVLVVSIGVVSCWSCTAGEWRETVMVFAE